MKSILTLLFSFSTLFATAQDSTGLKDRSFRIVINHIDTITINGWLANITDTSVFVSDEKILFRDSKLSVAMLTEYKYHQINFASVQRSNGGARGFGIGLLGGFVAGAAIGLASGDDKSGFIQFSAGEKALAGGVALGAVSGLVGAIIGGSIKKTFFINGQKENFNAMYNYVIQKAYGKQ